MGTRQSSSGLPPGSLGKEGIRTPGATEEWEEEEQEQEGGMGWDGGRGRGGGDKQSDPGDSRLPDEL